MLGALFSNYLEILLLLIGLSILLGIAKPMLSILVKLVAKIWKGLLCIGSDIGKEFGK